MMFDLVKVMRRHLPRQLSVFWRASSSIPLVVFRKAYKNVEAADEEEYWYERIFDDEVKVELRKKRNLSL